ncbi:MAG: PorT family protein, partial [Muribaculaceae bacterium]|nr:PorT family protein [Muribaculaceae bacterium]
GICGGIGGEYRLTPKQSILLEGRFYFGLGNIFHDGKADTFSASRSMTIQVTAAYLFRVI